MSSTATLAAVAVAVAATSDATTATPDATTATPTAPTLTKGARIKHVVTNPYHAWANQTRAGRYETDGGYEVIGATEETTGYQTVNGVRVWIQSANHAANGSGNRSFRGVSAYSYRAEIARIVTNAEGRRAYLLDCDRWTATTSKHQSEVRQAIPDGRVCESQEGKEMPVFSVGALETFDPARAVHKYVADAAEALAASRRARTNKEYRLAESARHLANARALAAFYGLTGVEIPDDAEGAADAVEAARKADAENRRKAEVRRLEEAREALDAWIAGTPNAYAPYGLTNAYMRVSPRDPNTVETTQGATVPTEHVRRAAPLILRALRTGGTYDGFPPVRLGHYSLNRVSNGVVTVGCHRFTRAEVERFAAVLGTSVDDADAVNAEAVSA